MSTKTAIQWTDVTDNIIVVEGGGWWCRMISPGCANCYAAALNQNDFYGGNKLPYSGEPPKLKLRKDVIDGWARQRHPKKHFVASMTDVFGEWGETAMVFDFLDGMANAPKQTFQVLTKRAAMALHFIRAWLTHRGLQCLPPNIWVGVSVEDQKRADERIPILLSIPAKVRFLSVEPMLGPVDLKLTHLKPQELLGKTLGGIDWVIFGGESGRNARPCNIEHIRSGVRQCREAEVAAFVKQLGSVCVTDEATPDGWPPGTELSLPVADQRIVRLKDKKGGDPSEWPEDLRVREFPTVT